MNMNPLTRLYPTLTPRERVPLMLGAMQRGDDQEFARLANAAPRQSWLITDFHGYACALSRTAWLQRIMVLTLEMAWWMDGVMVWNWPHSPRAEELDELRRVIDMGPILAYKCVVELDAWQQFCAELHVDPEVFWKDLPHYSLMKLSDKIVRDHAATPEEAAAYVRQHGEANVPTVEGVMADLRAVFDYLRSPWERP
jgi:hypothetical protein